MNRYFTLFAFISFLSLIFLISAQVSVSQERNYLEIKSDYEKFLKDIPERTKPRNNWIQRWLWNHRHNQRPGGFPVSDFSVDKRLKLKVYDNQLSESGWVPVGPINIPPTYEPRSCYSMGRVNCVAFHPTDSNIIWIGTPGGGVWKSVNHGRNWSPMSDNITTLAISHIAVDGKNPDVIYIATGDFDISGMSDDDAQGVFKSTDGGSTWMQTGLSAEKSFQSSVLRKIIINRDDSQKLLAAGRRGIWKSDDGGNLWRRVCDSIIVDAEVHPTESGTLYAAMASMWGNGTSGILKSTDWGENWSVLETNMPPKNEISRSDVAISPADPNYIYVLNVRANTNGFHSIFKSTDAGLTWSSNIATDSSDNILGAWGGDVSDRRGQGSYDLVLIADPNDKNKIYTGGINIWMSEDAGETWEQASFWIYVFGNSIHADHHFAAYNPVDKSYYWCNDGGIYRTKKIEPGSKAWINEWIDKYEENKKPGAPDYKFPTEWENLSDELAITEFYRMSMSKNNPDILAAGSQDNSCYYFNNGKWLNYIPNYDGMETMCDHDNPDIFFGVWQFGGLNRTMDGGKTLKPRLSDTIANLESGSWVTPTSMDPDDSKTIYMGYKNLWRSDDRGDNWIKVLDFDSLQSEIRNRNSLQIVKISPANSNYITVYKDIAWFQDTDKVWKRTAAELWISHDKGLNWMRSINGLPLDSINISSICYDNNNPLKMWAAVSTWYNTINTYLTEDGGETWKDISKPIPYGLLIRTIVHQPESFENTIYCGTNRGVYYTNDSLVEWLPYSMDLPNTYINELEIQESTGELFAATYGRGVWKTNLLPNSIESEKNSVLITINPNPATNEFTLNIKDGGNVIIGNIDIRVFDVTGKEVFRLSDYSSETYYLQKVRTGLNPGVYFLQVSFNGKKYSAKLIISR